MKSWLEKNDKEMHSTHNEGKSAVAEEILQPLRIKFINKWLRYQKMCLLIN